MNLKDMDYIIAFFDGWKIVDYVITGVIGTAITFLMNMIVSFFCNKRKKFCISKKILSSSVYQQTDEDGLKIKVMYNEKEIDGPISLMKICVKNDGKEDLDYSKRIKKLLLYFDGMDVIGISVSAEIADVKPVVITTNDGKYNLKWDILKCDESIIIKLVVKGIENDISKVKFEIRADGINSIKTPEYKVSEVMKPIIVSDIIFGVPILLFYPSSESYIGIMPMKVFMLIMLVVVTFILWISALLKRIKWLKEK